MSFFSAIKKFFVGSPTIKIEEDAGVLAPYKIPEPAVVTITADPAAVVKKKPATKKPAAAPKKPVAAKAAVRKPRTPKV
jgi:hypothetical protein